MTRLRFAVTGAQGQLGRTLIERLLRSGHEVQALGRTQLDVSDAEQVREVIGRANPDIVVHAAAYTKVDEAEQQPEPAYLVNGCGTRNVAAAAQEVGAKLIYISTDYVFNGRASVPYDEFSPTDPINQYGRSKWMGEYFTERLHSRYFIVRTSWVYGVYGANFVRTMLKLAESEPEVRVVTDQIGCPTYTEDLAECIERLAYTNCYGIYHASNSGSCSWYEFALEIFRQAGLKVHVKAVTSDQYVRAAARPAYSVFDHQALRLNGMPPMPPWQHGLRRFLLKAGVLGK